MKILFALLLTFCSCAVYGPTEDDLVGEIVDDSDAGVEVEAKAKALSTAMTWPGLSVRGYDNMNALKCWLDANGGNNSTCTYGVGYNGTPCGGGWVCSRCRSNGWGGFTYSTKVDPYSGKGEIWVENTRIVTSVALGPLLPGDLRTFTYDSGKYCRVFKSWGGTYAEFGP